MNIFRRVGRWLHKMIFGAKTIEDALGVKVLINQDLENNRQLWRDMLDGKAPWNNEDVPSLRLASGICKEAARYTAFELKSEIAGSPRADYLNIQYQTVIKSTLDNIATLVGNGAIIFKPYARGQRILSTTVTPSCFFPLKYNELGELTSVVFADTLQKEDNFYTLLETHEWNETAQEYIIKYNAFVKENKNDRLQSSDIGKPISLTQVEEWAHLQSESLFKNIPQPLFIECNMTDMKSIFADAVDIIKECDEQLGRTIWEYFGGELAIDASMDLFKKDRDGNLILPKNKKRLFRTLDVSNSSSSFEMQAFSPDFRDESLFRGLNEYKRIIEFIIGFAYGVISDPNQTDKTAEEIRAGKQRFLVTIKGVQNRIQEAYEKLVKSMDIIATIYNLSPQGDYDMSFTWGDSIMEDPDKEYERRKEMVSMGLLKPEQFVAWYFGLEYKEDDEEFNNQMARLMPDMPQELP